MSEHLPTSAMDADLAKAFYYFFTPTTPWEAIPFTPDEHQPQIPVAQPIPEPHRPLVDILVNARLPQYDDPNWFTKTFDMQACTCCAFYNNWQIVLNYEVGDTEMCIITGVSYDMPGLPIYSAFEVQVLRDGAEIARWEDMKVSSSPNPAEQFAFCGHAQDMPMWICIDRNQRLTVRVRLLGVYPYPNDPSVEYSGGICVLLHGFRPMIYDNRDGAPRPNAAGDLAQADLDPGRITVDGQTWDAQQLRERLAGFLKFMDAPTPPGLGT